MAATESIESGHGTDYRAAALAALKPIADKLNDMYGGANSFEPDAWNLIGFAGDKATELIEDSENELAHSGRLHCDIETIVALMRGALLVLEVKGDDRSVEEEGAFSLLSRYVPTMKLHSEDLERQSLGERNGFQVAEVQHG